MEQGAISEERKKSYSLLVISSVPTFLLKDNGDPVNIDFFLNCSFFDLNWTRKIESKDFMHLRF